MGWVEKTNTRFDKKKKKKVQKIKRENESTPLIQLRS